MPRPPTLLVPLSLVSVLVAVACSPKPPPDTTAVRSPPDAAMAALAPAPSDATGCAPGARCISVTSSGQPLASGLSVAQCRGRFADFIVPKSTIPAGYAGPWFQPELLERATTTGPTAARPWLAFDPRQDSTRLRYLLALRNYAFTSRDLRTFTPALTKDAEYRDPSAGGVAQTLRAQRWYPAPRMIYGSPSAPGSREAARGMTLERSIGVGELAGNTRRFSNYAVAYYDTRGANAYNRLWSTATAGKDSADTTAMRLPEGSLVYKLLFSAADSTTFPVDILQGSVAAGVIPNAGGAVVPVRLLQIDIAVKDSQAGTTGWYFATYAYDHTVQQVSPWRRMVPLGLMWGNDPAGPPLSESWINPNAPAYARDHLGVDGRLNGPVDNPASACMSCHGTAQAPSVAPMLPQGACNQEPFRAKWFRNLAGTQAFGRFTPAGATCDTTAPAIQPVAADYSLQLAATVTRSIGTRATFNPCTWDSDSPPAAMAAGGPDAAIRAEDAAVFPVTRDP